MNAILALAVKDLRLLVRDKAGFFFTFGFPLVFAIFFGSIMSGEGGSGKVKVALVDQDSSSGSKEFGAALEGEAALDLLVCSTVDEARDLVRHGKRAAYIQLKKGFGEGQRGLFQGKTATIDLVVDPSRKASTGMIEGILMKHGFQAFAKTFTDRNAMADQLKSALGTLPETEGFNPLRRYLNELDRFLQTSPEETGPGEAFGNFQPVTIRKSEVSIHRQGPRNPYEISFPQALIWAVMGTAASFGISLVSERTSGTLARLLTTPLTPRAILGGKALGCFVAALMVQGFLLTIGMTAFGIRPNSLPLLALAVASVSICFVGIMMLLSVLGKSERSASSIGWSVLMLLAMVGGGMIPLFIMPPWMQQIASISPIKWSILAIEGAIWRGFSLSEMTFPCLLLAVIGCLCFALGSRLFRFLQTD